MILFLALVAADFASSFNEGLSLIRQKKFVEALPFLEEALKERPGDFNANYLYGLANVELGRNEAGLRAWRKALATQPSNVKLLTAMSVEYSKGRYFQEAAAAAASALKLEPSNLSLYLVAIKTYQDAGDSDAAMRLAAEAARRFPESARAQFEYGFHLQKLGKVDEGLEHIRQAMKLDPGYEEPFFFYGDLLLKQGRAQEAIAPLQHAIRNRNDYTPARTTLARAYMQLKQWDDARRECEEAAKVDPRHPQPHVLLSQIYFRLGDEGRAQAEKELSRRLRAAQPEIMEAAQPRPFPR